QHGPRPTPGPAPALPAPAGRLAVGPEAPPPDRPVRRRPGGPDRGRPPAGRLPDRAVDALPPVAEATGQRPTAHGPATASGGRPQAARPRPDPAPRPPGRGRPDGVPAMNDSLPPEVAGAESLVSRLSDEFLDRLDRGERPEVEEYAARHPDLAAVLRQILPALEALRSPAEGSGFPTDPMPLEPHAIGLLGDYRI